MRTTRVDVHLHQDAAGDFSDAVKQEVVNGVRKIFAFPGFAVEPQFVNATLTGSSLKVEDSVLLERLRSLAKPSLPQSAWFTRILIARSSDRAGKTFGVMFDSDRRSGAAVFLKAIKEAGFDPWPPLLIRTMAHELGHVFNLAHEDGTGARDIMNSQGLTPDQLASPELSERNRGHLLSHEEKSVCPDTDVRFGVRSCKNDHDPADFSDIISSAFGSHPPRKAFLRLRSEPGAVYPDTSQATYVIGEPVHLTVELVNGSRRSVVLPRWPETATQEVVIYRMGPDGAVSLIPPHLHCRCDGSAGWARLEPGRSAIFHETLLFRNGELVFPREGTYHLIAGLRLRKRWITSDALTVRVAPPLKRRHEKACEAAADPEAGLFVELGGAMFMDRAFERLERLARTNPKFPLNCQVRLLGGRRAVLAPEPTPPSWQLRLAGLATDRHLPRTVRDEAKLLLLLDRVQEGERPAAARLRQRLSDDLRLPIPIHAATLIRRRLEDLLPPHPEEA